MGLVIKELTHPYSLTHKNYNKKKDEVFGVGFPRKREYFLFSKAIFLDFPHFFLIFPHFFCWFLYFFHTKNYILFMIFLKNIWGGGGIYRRSEEMGG